MRLAARMPRLRSLTYISTCFTNINRPRGSRVDERIYPLKIAGKEVDVTGLAEVRSLPCHVPDGVVLERWEPAGLEAATP